jgi:acyl carrier protein
VGVIRKARAARRYGQDEPHKWALIGTSTKNGRDQGRDGTASAGHLGRFRAQATRHAILAHGAHSFSVGIYSNMDIKFQIRDFLARNLLFSEDGFKFTDDASFLEEGIVDSLGVMELVAFVQKAFNITVDPQDVTPDNFDTVNKLAAFIQRRSPLNLPSPPDLVETAVSH